MLVQPILAPIFHDLVIDAGEEGGKAMVVVLRPAIEGMIVAFRALQANAEKHLRRRLRAHLRIAQGPIVIGRRVAVAAAPRRDELPRELVERLALRQPLANPMMEYVDSLGVEYFLLIVQ